MTSNHEEVLENLSIRKDRPSAGCRGRVSETADANIRLEEYRWMTPVHLNRSLSSFRGELQAQEKYAEVIQPLNVVAQNVSKPFNQRAFMALSNCYRHEGQDQLADEAAAAARLDVE